MRFQFQSDVGQASWRPRLFTEAIKMLIIINTVMFILRTIFPQITTVFGLTSSRVLPLIWQPITYMFMHGDLFHVLINMVVLWMFGTELETLWGRKPFLKFYFITGVGSGLVWLLFNLGNPYAVLIGASGAIYGILLAYGLMFPNRTIYLYFLIPIKVKWFVLILGGLAFFSSWQPGGNISHMTHLSGMIIGYIYLNKDSRWKQIRLGLRQLYVNISGARKKARNEKDVHFQVQIDQILEKISKDGYHSLSKEDQEMLYSASSKISKRREKN